MVPLAHLQSQHLVFQDHQGRHSNQSHVPWHWLFLCPARKSLYILATTVTKTLKSPKWHWLILPPIGANEDHNSQ